jgi:hypothetical protein
MKVIVRTRYRGPAVRGARITAEIGTRVSVPFDHSAPDPHLVAVERLARQLADGQGFTIEAVDGGPDGRRYEVTL